MLGSAHVKNHSAGDSPMGLATLNITRHYILFFLFKPKQNRETLVWLKYGEWTDTERRRVQGHANRSDKKSMEMNFIVKWEKAQGV